MPDFAPNESVGVIFDQGWVVLHEGQLATRDDNLTAIQVQYTLIEVPFGRHPDFRGDPTRALRKRGDWKLALLTRVLSVPGKSCPEISVTALWITEACLADLARDPSVLASEVPSAGGGAILIESDWPVAGAGASK